MLSTRPSNSHIFISVFIFYLFFLVLQLSPQRTSLAHLQCQGDEGNAGGAGINRACEKPNEIVGENNKNEMGYYSDEVF